MDASEVSLLVNRLLCEEPVPLEVLRGVGNEIPGGFQSRQVEHSKSMQRPPKSTESGTF